MIGHQCDTLRVTVLDSSRQHNSRTFIQSRSELYQNSTPSLFFSTEQELFSPLHTVLGTVPSGGHPLCYVYFLGCSSLLTS